jgi:hypothetical protein
VPPEAVPPEAVPPEPVSPEPPLPKNEQDVSIAIDIIKANNALRYFFILILAVVSWNS